MVLSSVLSFCVAMAWTTASASEFRLHGSMVLLVLLPLAAAAYARRTARRFLDPLSLEIHRIHFLNLEISGGQPPEVPGEGPAKSELEILRQAVSQMELALALGRDTSLKVESERARSAHASKMASLGEMASGIAHEINTPLAVIVTKAAQSGEILGEEPVDKEMLQALNASIAATAGRIARIVSGLRSISRDSSSEEARAVEAGDLIGDVLALCGERFRLHGVELRLPGPEAALKAMCRPVQAMQILLNLLNNAFDAIQESPRRVIAIGCGYRRGMLEIAVSDSGAGVPRELAHKIFEPFFTTKGPGKGTGLGLSISRGIAQAQGGTLRLELGRDQLEGSRFVLGLPCAGVDNLEDSHDPQREGILA